MPQRHSRSRGRLRLHQEASTPQTSAARGTHPGIKEQHCSATPQRSSPKPTRRWRVDVSIGTHTRIKEVSVGALQPTLGGAPPATSYRQNQAPPPHRGTHTSIKEQHCFGTSQRSSPKPTRHWRVGVSIGEVGVGAFQPTLGGASPATNQLQHHVFFLDISLHAAAPLSSPTAQTSPLCPYGCQSSWGEAFEFGRSV